MMSNSHTYEIQTLWMPVIKTAITWYKSYTSEVFIQKFNITVDNFKSNQLIVRLLNGAAKIKTGIPTENRKK